MNTAKYASAAKKIRTSLIPMLVLMAFFTAVSWYIIKPLAIPLAWSILLSYFAHPLFNYLDKRLFRGKYTNLAASISTAVILVFMALPILLLSIFLTKEAMRISRNLMESGLISASYSELTAAAKTIPFVGNLADKFGQMANLPLVDTLIKNNARYVTSFLTAVSSRLFESLLSMLLVLLIVAITSFFLVRDGDKMIRYASDLLPLSDEARKNFIGRTAVMLKAVVCGVIMTAAIQGALGGLGWWYVGLSHPVFFGFCMFLTAMIPFVGTPSVWVPGAMVLLLHGDYVNCGILLAWGLLVVSTIDNFIKPIFISEGSNIHMLVIFIGLFGGLYAWGFLGVFVGPLILSLALFMLDIYHSILKTPYEITPEEKEDVNND
ncbi:MAG: AI-2E family transporter [Synergistes sp.]|nr:AI-2E family transporter [Synergistes sp.]